MICPYCGTSLYPSRPMEYIYCSNCQHRLDPEDVKEDDDAGIDV